MKLSRKLAAILIAFLLVNVHPAFAATRTPIATDNFNRAAPLGSNWATLNNLAAGDMTIVASLRTTGTSASAARAAARWVGTGTFTDDQYSSLVITALGFITSDYSIGVICRAGAGTDASRSFYEVLVLGDSAGPNYTTQVNKVVTGTRTTLDSTSRAWTTSDRVEIECQGTTIRGMKNGSAFFTVTDSDVTTGQPGIAGSNDNTDGRVTGDDWEGGSLTTPATVPNQYPRVIG